MLLHAPFYHLQVLAKVRALIDALPDINEDEAEAAESYSFVMSGAPGSRATVQPSKPDSAGDISAQQPVQLSRPGKLREEGSSNASRIEFGKQPQSRPGAGSGATDEDDDPFGLGAMLGSASQQPPAGAALEHGAQPPGRGSSRDDDADDDPFGLDAMISKPVCP